MRTGLIVAGLMAAGVGQTADEGSVSGAHTGGGGYRFLQARDRAEIDALYPGDLPSILLQHRLVLVYRARDDELFSAVLPYLRDFAAVYGNEGLAVVLMGSSEGMTEPWFSWPLLRLSEARGLPDEAELAMYRQDGSVVAVMERSAVDLYAVYRRCEKVLHGRDHVTLAEHVKQVIGNRIAAGSMAASDDESQDILIEDVLRGYPHGCLLLPPGCNDCMLEKRTAVLGDLFAALPDIPVFTFDFGTAEQLSRLGWHGTQYVLPSDPESRLLSLRQAGNYQPLLISLRSPQGLEARSIRSKEGP